MDRFIEYLLGVPVKRPVVSFSDKERIFAEDKSDLDRTIALKQRHGWILLSRSYSMEDGHGATLARQVLSKAA